MTTLLTTFLLGAATALAQTDVLRGVTMRVLDDLRGVDAVVLELDAKGSENAQDTDENRGAAPAQPEQGANAPLQAAPAEPEPSESAGDEAQDAGERAGGEGANDRPGADAPP